MGYSEKSTGAVSFNASGNFDQDKGTLEMWVKLGWDPNEDTQTRTFVRIKSGHNAHNGLLLFRYGPRRTGLAWMSYGPAGTTSADISGWKRDTWHHLAVTWDKDADVKQIFLDGVFVSKDKMDDIPAPDVIYVGCVTARASKARLAGALIDELRITDGVLWKGRKKGEKVFDPPGKPYAAPSTSGK